MKSGKTTQMIKEILAQVGLKPVDVKLRVRNQPEREFLEKALKKHPLFTHSDDTGTLFFEGGAKIQFVEKDSYEG